MPPLLRLLRPHQYAKNLLLFSAPGAAGRMDEPRVVGLSIAAFVLFCAVSSAGYVVNDLLDVEADRLHPKKQFRPIASGEVSEKLALTVAGVLAVAAVGLASLLGWPFLIALVLYGGLTFSYSTVLKHIPWIELLAVSAGFLVRALAGGRATDTPISVWFLLVVSAGAFLLITGKRLGERISLEATHTPGSTRRVLAGYSTNALRQAASVAAAFAVGSYGAWAAAEASDRASDSLGSTVLRITALPFAFAIARYLILAWRGAGETPESLVVRDRIVLGAGVIWLVLYAIGIYL